MQKQKKIVAGLGLMMTSVMSLNYQTEKLVYAMEENMSNETILDTKEVHSLFVFFYVEGNHVSISVDKGTFPEGTKIMYNIENSISGWEEYTGPVELNYGSTTISVKAVFPDGTESRVYSETVTVEKPESIYPAYISPILSAYDRTVEIRFDEPLPEGTKVMYKLNGSEWEEYVGSISVGYGVHTFDIKAIYPDGFESNVIQMSCEFVELIYPSNVMPFVNIKDKKLELNFAKELPEDAKVMYRLNDTEWTEYNYELIPVEVGNYKLEVQVLYPNGECTGIYLLEGKIDDITEPTYPTLIYPTINVGENEVYFTFTYQPLPEGTTVMYRLNDADWTVYEGPFYVPTGMYHLQIQAIYPDGSMSDIRFTGGYMSEPSTPGTPEDEVVALPGQIQDVVISAGNTVIDFNPNIYDYNLEIEDTTSEVTLDFKLPEGSEVQKMMINGEEVDAIFPLKINLLQEETVVEITVKSNARNVHTYTFVFNKKTTTPPSTPNQPTPPSTPNQPTPPSTPNQPTPPSTPNQPTPPSTPNQSDTNNPTTDYINQNNSSTNTNRPVTGFGGIVSILSGLGLTGTGVITYRRKK